jgi:uncharacterized protein YkwD
MLPHGLRRPLLAAPLAALALLAPSPATAQSPDCAGADVLPTPASLDAARDATLCLLNAERQERGLRPLRQNDKLGVAAESYSREMVEHKFFAHVSAATGSTLRDRVSATTYLRGASGWQLGENLAWGSGELSTPARTVVAWMRSPGHRDNILTRRFREIGIGIVAGAPTRVPDSLSAATYTTEFGVRG